MAGIWSLNGLLRFRRLEEDQAAGELAQANGRLRETQRSQDRARRRLAGFADSVTDIATLRALAAARSTGSAMIVELATVARLAEVDAMQAQERFQAARRNTMSLEKLETRFVETQNAAELREEQLALDEIASTRRSSTGRPE